MRTNAALFASLIATFSGYTFGDECTELGIAVGQEIVKSSITLDKESLDKYDFCKYDYSKASGEEKASIEASYTKVASVDGKLEKKSVQEKQSQLCEGKFGFARSALLNTSESRTWSPVGQQVMDACYNRDTVRVVSAAYSAQTVRFTVRNGTADRAEIRDYRASPAKMVEKCDLVNYDTGAFGRGKYIAPLKSVDVICTLQTRRKPGADETQVTYGGGFIALDAPNTTLKSLPVPEVTTPSVGERERDYERQLERSQDALAALRLELNGANLRVQQAQSATTAVRAAFTDAQNSAIQRVHVVPVGLPPIVPNSPRFHRAEDNGVACVANWGPAAVAFATKVCADAGTPGFAFDALQSVGGGPCGYTITAFMCKVPVP